MRDGALPRDEGAEPYRLLEAGETARPSVEAMLRANADLFTRASGPSGCMLTRVVSSCPEDDADVRACLDDSVEQRISDIETRLERGAVDGEALPCTEVRALAEYVDAIVHGMAVRAIEGGSCQSLHRIVDIAMRVWDT